MDLPDIRRVVTYHDEGGKSVVQSDMKVKYENVKSFGDGIRDAGLWANSSVPTSDNNTNDDATLRPVDSNYNLGVGVRNGVTFRSTDLGPGRSTTMHRTSSVDYNILIQGELILIMEDGKETHLKTPGDSVIQKGTLHAWKNPTDKWARWHTVVVDADPAIVDGKEADALS